MSLILAINLTIGTGTLGSGGVLPANVRITEDTPSQVRITESGDERVTES